MTAPAATMSPMAETETRSSFRQATRELLHQTAFAAARAQLESRTWSEITMNDIALEAGVSRQTLYNEFGSRNEFGLAFVMHEAANFLEGVEVAIRGKADDPRAAVNVAFEQFLVVASEDPMIATLLSDDGTGGMLPFITTRGTPVIAWVSQRIATVIVETWPEMRAEDASLIAENLVRLAISNVTAPTGTRDETAVRVGRLIGPFIDQALGQAD